MNLNYDFVKNLFFSIWYPGYYEIIAMLSLCQISQLVDYEFLEAQAYAQGITAPINDDSANVGPTSEGLCPARKPSPTPTSETTATTEHLHTK